MINLNFWRSMHSGSHGCELFVLYCLHATWSSYLTNFLSLRLVEVVAARNDVELILTVSTQHIELSSPSLKITLLVSMARTGSQDLQFVTREAFDMKCGQLRFKTSRYMI